MELQNQKHKIRPHPCQRQQATVCFQGVHGFRICVLALEVDGNSESSEDIDVRRSLRSKRSPGFVACDA